MRKAAQIALFVPLLLAYWYVHGNLAVWVQWVPALFSERPFRLAGLVLGAILCGALAGAILAGPFRLLYQRRDLQAAIIVSILAGAFDAYFLSLAGALPFTVGVLLLDLAVYIVALPLCVLALRRMRPMP